MKSKVCIRSNEGSVLVITLVMIAVMTAVAASMITLASREHVLSKRTLSWSQSVCSAEAGVDFGWNEINKLTGINTNNTFMSAGQWSGPSTGPWQTTQTITPMSGSEFASSFGATVDTNSAPPNIIITSIGAASSALITTPVSRTVVATLKPMTPFSWAILAKQQINFSGTPYIDSWISGPAQTPYSPAVKLYNGSIGTNGQLINAGLLNILGSIKTGPGGTVTGTPTVQTNPAPGSPTNTISNGLQTYIPPVKPPWAKGSTPGVPVAPGVLPAPAPLNLTVTGTQKYEAGAVTGDITISGSGTVTVYVDSLTQSGGNFTITPNPVGADLKVIFYSAGAIKIDGISNSGPPVPPGNVIFYGLPTCPSIELTQNNNFTSAAIYAPSAAITVRNGQQAFYGSIVGNTVSVDTTAIHYDESMKNLGLVLGYALKSWQEK